MNKFPLLVLVPHGGLMVPEELETSVALDRFQLFVSADSYANELFALAEISAAVLDTHLSRMTLDVNRSPLELPPETNDGVIKSMTPYAKNVFNENCFPDAMAVANILKRYYFPYHQACEKILSTGEIKLIIECHTHAAVAEKELPDQGMPRPLVIIQNCAEHVAGTARTAREELAQSMQESFEKYFSHEECPAQQKVIIGSHPAKGHLMKKYGMSHTPMLKVSINRGLFFNDTYFNMDYMKADELRLNDIRERIKKAVEHTAEKWL